MKILTKVTFLIIVLVSNSILAEDVSVDDRSFNRLKFLIENPKPHSRIPLTRKEAIIALGFFGDERHSEYLCNLLTKESYKEEIKEIFRALSMHNGKTSLKCLVEYIKLNPDNFDSYYAMDAIGNNRGNDIELELEKMLYQTKDKTREKFLSVLRNVTRNRQGKYTVGIDREEILDNLDREKKTNEWLFVDYIFKSIDNTDYEKALHWSDRLVKMNSKLWVGYMLKGNALQLMEKNTEAIDFYLKAINLNNSDSNSYFLLADIYKSLNERNLAIKNYEYGIKYSKSLINRIIAGEKIQDLAH